MGTIDGLSPDSEIQAIYVAYFGRAADSGGAVFWEQDYSNLIAAGNSPDQALTNIADSFAPQTETATLFPQIPSILSYQQANPGGPTVAPPATLVSAVTSFVSDAYLNMFNRPLAAGDNFWVDEILGVNPTTGASQAPIAIGSALLLIANGAIGADATTLLNKITVGDSFTSGTSAAGLGFGTPTAGYLQEAHTVVGATTSDAATVTAQQAAITAFINGSSVQTFTLTQDVDTFSATSAGAVFNAAPVANAFSGFANNTLNAGDNLQDSVGDGTLNFTASGFAVANPADVTGVTVNGINTLNYAGIGGVFGSVQGDITGLTVANITGSTGGLGLGGVGQGLNTLLTNVNISGYGGGNGSTAFSGTVASGVASAAAGINIAITGPVGSATFGDAVILSIQNDGNTGTAASPNLSYGGWDLTLNSNADLQLEQGGGVGGATGLKVNGAGNVGLGQDLAGNWQKLTNIDLSASTGAVDITGATAHNLTNAAPNATFGSDAGLLDDTGAKFALTHVILGTGVDTIDVSSASISEFSNLTTVLPTGSAISEIIVSDAVATTGLNTTWTDIAGFSTVGVDGIGGAINMANLPTSINDIFYQTLSTGDVVVTNQAAPLTVDTEQNGFFSDLTVSTAGSAAQSLTIVIGNDALSAPGALGDVSTTSDNMVAITANGGSAAVDTTDAVTLQPTTGGSEAVTINGDGAGLTFEAGLVENSAPGVLSSPSNMDVTIGSSGHITGVVTIENGGNPELSFVLPTGTVGLYTPLEYSTNAASIDASNSGGLIMDSGSLGSHFDTGTLVDDGVTLTGSTTAGNVLIGSVGNDTLNGTTSLTNADTIVTEGGSDTITLAANHTAHDSIDLYAAAPGLVTPGSPAIAAFASITGFFGVDGDVAQLGTFGVTTQTGNFFATGLGNTVADLSTVSGFVPGSAANGGDSVALSVGAWGPGGTNQFGGVNEGLVDGSLAAPVPGSAGVFQDVSAGGVTLNAGTDVVFVGTQATLGNVASFISSTASGFNFATPLLATDNYHLIIAWDDNGHNLHLSDADFVGAGSASSTSAAGTAVNLSDMVELVGVNHAQIETGANAFAVHFVA